MNQLRVDDKFKNALRAELVSQVQKTAPIRSRKPVRLWLAAGALAGAGILGGVAAGVFVLPGSQQASPQSSALSSYEVEDTLAAFGGVSSDYNPFHSPEEIAAASQVIVQGTVEGVREGRTGTGIDSIVMIVNIQGVVQGELPRGNDGNVYLELPGSGSSDPLYYAKALPEGAAVVAYMVPAWDGTPSEGTDATIENPNAGRPDGQALFLPAGPQGLVLQVGDQDVVWPLIGEWAPGKIADTLPGGSLIRG
ncbi:hypothetical protein QFZ79_002667 [Arthrobacter sp. V4I6]|uniref:hypothetical protein n=1 Tax=unclassified Arthrobacter TaxID=235627 RepID=UPI00277FAC1A|nr:MULTISPECIES: hypothetical protein [unclassified Arthrobacter]MDQ0820375.1 hypothetical protein [Arthrobacter sp. V1I7]MDQ0854556.1 hypothetical protein [Arthrobacter sp. V4I6]